MKIQFENIIKGSKLITLELKYCILNIISIFSLLFAKSKIEIIEIHPTSSEFMDLNFIGEIDTRNKEFVQSVLEKTNKNCKSSCNITYIDCEKEDEIEDLLRKNTFINFAWHKDLILNHKGKKIGICVFKEADNDTFFEIIKRKRMLLKNGAKVCIAYIIKDKRKYTQHKQFVKEVAKAGFNGAIGSANGLGLRRGIRSLNFKESKIFYNIGKIRNTTNKEKGFRSYPILRLGIDVKNKRIAQQSYYPAYALNGDKEFYICDEYPNDKFNIKVRKDLKKMFKNVRTCGAEIYLKDLFEVNNISIPKKYSYMKNYTVDGICSRTLELGPGNVFFFRDQFRDKNDKDIQSERKRNKLVRRAVLRKTLFIFSYKKLAWFIPHVVVENPTEAHISTIAAYRKKLNTRFIGITGSVGKTSTKDMLYQVISQEYKTEKSLHNSNVQIKIGLNVQNIKEDTEFFIQEIGGGRPGGASRHSRMILPEVAIVTNIGSAHIGNYESQEDLMYNKLGISEGFQKGGKLFLNGDDVLLFNADKTRLNCDVCYFAIENKNADYYAENIIERGEQTYFDIVSKEGRVSAVLNVLGIHNVLNAVCSYAVGKHFNIPDENIINGIALFKTAGIRQNLIEVSRYRLFMDCFNASAPSVETSLQTLKKFEINKENKKIAIIGDITGMGDKLDDINITVANIINEYYDSFDTLILYGNNGFKIKGDLIETDKVTIINEQENLISWIEGNIKRGDITLFKGSSKMKLDEIVDEVFGINTSDPRYLEESLFKTKEKKKLKYRIFPEHTTVYKGNEATGIVKIPNKMNGKTIKKIGFGAFKGNREIECVTISDNSIHIGAQAFLNCTNMKEFNHNNTIRFIGHRAFENCKSLKEFIMPDSIKVLFGSAFKNCTSLEKVTIKSSLVTIYKDTFARCINLKDVNFEEGLESIENGAFANCISLEEIILPSSLKVIKNNAFDGCKNLKKVYLSKDTFVGKKAFENCKNVELTIK